MLLVPKKNRFNETVLLSTKTYNETDGYENNCNFKLKYFSLTGPMRLYMLRLLESDCVIHYLNQEMTIHAE